MKSLDAVCLGEALVDFVSLRSGVSLARSPGFEKCAGGSSANVAVGLSKLGAKVAFMGKLGNDGFGQFLIDTLKKHRVETSGIVKTSFAQTSLAFVSLKKNGERDFCFYRSPGAHSMLTEGEINEALVRKASLFHFSSVSLVKEPARAATIQALKKCRSHKQMISFDPNVRLSLWKGSGQARKIIRSVFSLVDIMKMNEEEMHFLTGKSNFQEAIGTIPEKIKIVIVTFGKKGCVCRWNGVQLEVPGIKVKPIDTTGAGDAFMAGFLCQIARLLRKDKTIESATRNEIAKILSFANLCGGLTTETQGAISAGLSLKRMIKYNHASI